MSYEDPDKRFAAIKKEVFDPNSPLYLENLLDLAASVNYDIHCSGSWKNGRSAKAFLDRYTNLSDRILQYRISINDFQLIKTVGQGGFGRVDLVKHKQTKNIYALKVIEKATYIQNAFNGFWEERDILVKNDSDWLVKCFYAFIDLKKLYIAMEYMPGGNLYRWLMAIDEFNEEQTHFYAMEMVMAIETLHNMGYLHRDLKPDNMLLDRNGHLKLTDFGTCIKVNKDGKVKTNFQVGTPDYIAPEVLRKAGVQDLEVGFEIDWWSFGIVIYELFYGETPFEGESTATLYKNIMSYQVTLCFPDDKEASKEFIDFLRKLLTEPNVRMGINEVKRHPYFTQSNFNWTFSNIRDQQPPLIIDVGGEDDTKYIDYDPNDKRGNIQNSFASNNFFSGENLAFSGFTFNRTHTYNRWFSGNPIRQISDTSTELETKISELELSKQQLNSKLEKQIIELSQSHLKIEYLENELSNKEKALSSKNSDVKETTELNKILKGKLDSLTKNLESVNMEKEQLGNRLIEKEKSVTNYLLEIDSLNEKVCNLNKVLSTKDQKIDELNRNVDGKQAMIDSIHNLNLSLQQEQVDAQSLHSLIQEKTSLIEKYELEIKTLNGKFNELSISNLGMKVEHSSGDVGQLLDLEEKYKSLVQDKEMVENKLMSLEKELKQIKTERTNLSTELITEKRKFQAMEKDFILTRKDLVEKNSTIASLLNQFHESEDQRRVFRQRISALENECDQMEHKMNMERSLREMKESEIAECRAKFEEDIEKMESSCSFNLNLVDKERISVSNELKLLKEVHSDKLRELEGMGSVQQENKRLQEVVDKLRNENDDKRQKVLEMTDNEIQLKMDLKKAREESELGKMKVQSLMIKFEEVVKNPKDFKKFTATRNNKKEQKMTAEASRRLKELESDLAKAQDSNKSLMNDYRLMQNDNQRLQERCNNQDIELSAKQKQINDLIMKVDSLVGIAGQSSDEVQPGGGGIDVMRNILNTALEGKISLLVKGKGRHKISWVPSFLKLLPFQFELYSNEKDTNPTLVLNLRNVMHLKEASEADLVHIQKQVLPQVLQIIYSKTDSDDLMRRQSVVASELIRTKRSTLLMPPSSDDTISMRSSMTDLSNCLSDIMSIENHSFVRVRFKLSATCEICHQSCSDFFNPPDCLECHRCKMRIHEEHIGKAKIMPCASAMEIMSILLETPEMKVVWMKRFGQLKKYMKDKDQDFHIAPNTYYRSIRHSPSPLSTTSGSSV